MLARFGLFSIIIFFTNDSFSLIANRVLCGYIKLPMFCKLSFILLNLFKTNVFVHVLDAIIDLGPISWLCLLRNHYMLTL